MSRNYIITVREDGGRLQSHQPITVAQDKIQSPINSLTDIADVYAVEVVDGATVVYNFSQGRYEVKEIDLDGGTF